MVDIEKIVQRAHDRFSGQADESIMIHTAARIALEEEKNVHVITETKLKKLISIYESLPALTKVFVTHFDKKRMKEDLAAHDIECINDLYEIYFA